MATFEEASCTGEVRRLLIVPQSRTDETGIGSATTTGPIDVTFEGFPGEYHTGLTRKSCMRVAEIYEQGTEIRNVRQLSIISEEEMALVAEGMGLDVIEPEWLGANLLVSGIPHVTLLPPSTRLLFSGGLSLVVDMENEPCGFPAREIKKVHGSKANLFVKNARHRRGVTAWVEKDGPVAEGDSIRVFVPSQPPWPGP